MSDFSELMKLISDYRPMTVLKFIEKGVTQVIFPKPEIWHKHNGRDPRWSHARIKFDTKNLLGGSVPIQLTHRRGVVHSLFTKR